MIEYIVLGFSFLLAFGTSYFCIPLWIQVTKKFSYEGKDMNKPGKPKVAEMGGIVVLSSFLLGMFYYIGVSSFSFNQTSYLKSIYALLLTVTMATGIGMGDDILGWKIGLKQRFKVLLTLPIALPMMTANVGRSLVNLPFLGKVDFGISFPLIILPIGIIGATNGFNLLAGYNGLEAGLGIIILSTLGIIAFFMQKVWLGIIAFVMICSLLGFLKYNWYPARIFPGDSLTYPIGALIACIAILGKMEKIALLLFFPFYVDLIFLIIKGFDVEAFAKVNKDGSLELPKSSLNDTAHLAIWVLQRIKRKVYEKDVTLSILGFELVLGLLSITWFQFTY